MLKIAASLSKGPHGFGDHSLGCWGAVGYIEASRYTFKQMLETQVELMVTKASKLPLACNGIVGACSIMRVTQTNDASMRRC